MNGLIHISLTVFYPGVAQEHLKIITSTEIMAEISGSITDSKMLNELAGWGMSDSQGYPLNLFRVKNGERNHRFSSQLLTRSSIVSQKLKSASHFLEKPQLEMITLYSQNVHIFNGLSQKNVVYLWKSDLPLYKWRITWECFHKIILFRYV